MARRKLGDKNTRKLMALGQSVGVTLPIEMVRKLRWQRKQKVTVSLKGKKIIIEDWSR